MEVLFAPFPSSGHHGPATTSNRMDSGLVTSYGSASRTCKCISSGPMNLFTSKFLRWSWTSSLYSWQFAWDGANFLCSSWYGAVFGICAENSVDNSRMFFLLLDSMGTYSSCAALPAGGLGMYTGDWEGNKILGEGTQLEHVTLTDLRLFSTSHWIVRRILNDNQLRHFLRQSVFWDDWCFLYEPKMFCSVESWLFFPSNFSSFRKKILLCRASTEREMLRTCSTW